MNQDPPKIITVSLDVTKLRKERFFKGKKGTYANLVLIHHPGEFGDYMVKEDSTKEEREARVQNPIVGNAKIAGKAKASPPTTQRNYDPNEGDSVPF